MEKFKWKDIWWFILAGVGCLAIQFLIIGGTNVEEVPSAPETIVFKTGGMTVFLTVVLILFGLAALVIGIDRIVRKGKEIGLLACAGGIIWLIVICSLYSISENVVINKITKTLIAEKHYILRPKKELRIPLADIHVVKVERGEAWSEGIRTVWATVKIVISDGTELEVSKGYDAPKFQYKLAKAISDAAGISLSGEKNLDSEKFTVLEEEAVDSSSILRDAGVRSPPNTWKCEKCGTEISAEFVECPHCGEPRR